LAKAARNTPEKKAEPEKPVEPEKLGLFDFMSRVRSDTMVVTAVVFIALMAGAYFAGSKLSGDGGTKLRAEIAAAKKANVDLEKRLTSEVAAVQAKLDEVSGQLAATAEVLEVETLAGDYLGAVLRYLMAKGSQDEAAIAEARGPVVDGANALKSRFDGVEGGPVTIGQADGGGPTVRFGDDTPLPLFLTVDEAAPSDATAASASGDQSASASTEGGAGASSLSSWIPQDLGTLGDLGANLDPTPYWNSWVKYWCNGHASTWCPGPGN
jgi:hypothetical protein